jgi:O-antigen/teichoic acid export membrane protein
MLWGTAGLFVAKLGSAAAALALGWIFGTGEYGAASAALSAAMIGDVLTDGGLRRVLITRGSEYPRLARTAFAVALAFNLTGCALMFGAAGFYRAEHPDAVGQLIVFGIALVLSTLGTVQRCKLTIDLRYAQSTFLGTASSLLRNVLTVAFAWYGLGPLAFALPLIFVNLWEAAYVRYVAGSLPPSKLDGGLARELIGQGRWVILAMVGSSLIARGDFLVATWMLDRDLSGAYYFAFVPLALFAPFSAGAVAMIQPVLARLRDDPARATVAFVKVVRMSVFVGAALSLGTVLIAPLLIHLAWRGRWDAVAPAVQLLAAAECARQLLAICLATLDARGQWHRSAAMVLIDGALTVAAAIAGCATGSVVWLAAIIAAQRTLTSLAEAAYVYARSGSAMNRAGAPKMIVAQVIAPLAIAGAIAAVVIGASHAYPTLLHDQRWLLAAMVPPALLMYAAAGRLLMPVRFAEIVELVAGRFRRSPVTRGG